MKYEAALPPAPRTGSSPRRVVVTVPPEPHCTCVPGDRITTASGEATVTAIEPVGQAQVIHARHGAGLPQPYRVEDVLWVGTKVQATFNLFGKLELLDGVVIEPLVDIPSVAFVDFQHGDRTLQVQLPKDRLFPHRDNSPIEQIHAPTQGAIDAIQQEISRIQAAGDVAPDKCWIERSPCHKRPGKFQAYYRTNDPVVFGGHAVKYIGMRGSVKDLAATAAIARRNDIDRLLRQLAILWGT